MAKRTILTAVRLREILHYNPKTGKFRWIDTSGAHWRGWAGYTNQHPRSGYVIIDINNQPYYAHVLAYAWMTGKWPDEEIDHKNRIPNDNRWRNLRPATRLQNCLNSKRRADNTSGMKGVGWNRTRRRWVVRKLGIVIGEFKQKEKAMRIGEQLHKVMKSFEDKLLRRKMEVPH